MGAAVRSGAPACVRRIAGSPEGRRAAARPPAGCLGAATGDDGLARPAVAGACQPRTAEGEGPASAGRGHQEDGNAGLDAPMIGWRVRPDAEAWRGGEVGPVGVALPLKVIGLRILPNDAGAGVEAFGRREGVEPSS
jgi:hypothetical protein